jgi:hypothetical protein
MSKRLKSSAPGGRSFPNSLLQHLGSGMRFHPGFIKMPAAIWMRIGGRTGLGTGL